MLTKVSLLLIIHFIADFLFQTDWMALNKSKSWKALLAHTSVYSVCFLPFGVQFALATFVLHTLTDAVTSRITSRLWFFEDAAKYKDLSDLFGYPLFKYVEGRRHWFFVVIGLDQLIHGLTLLWTLMVLYGL